MYMHTEFCKRQISNYKYLHVYMHTSIRRYYSDEYPVHTDIFFSRKDITDCVSGLKRVHNNGQPLYLVSKNALQQFLCRNPNELQAIVMKLFHDYSADQSDGVFFFQFHLD